ncbi:hypothetical protein LJC71_10160 [Desulfosarcina sp. OttesenSCG-928-A07]|nr:hypothetical protein [Desulfosarcina sp. OttesenSCG-928-G17]MDL2330083.1 hypothetical protein [Desulfosarcina sp. OttesenSCG-928-A07]
MTQNPHKPQNTLSWNRGQAKVGMAVSLGVLVGTGLVAHMAEKDRAGIAHTVHVVAGVALVGFSYWHWSLYQRPSSNRSRAS